MGSLSLTTNSDARFRRDENFRRLKTTTLARFVSNEVRISVWKFNLGILNEIGSVRLCHFWLTRFLLKWSSISGPLGHIWTHQWFHIRWISRNDPPPMNFRPDWLFHSTYNFFQQRLKNWWYLSIFVYYQHGSFSMTLISGSKCSWHSNAYMCFRAVQLPACWMHGPDIFQNIGCHRVGSIDIPNRVWCSCRNSKICCVEFWTLTDVEAIEVDTHGGVWPPTGTERLSVWAVLFAAIEPSTLCTPDQRLPILAMRHACLCNCNTSHVLPALRGFFVAS